MNYELVSFKICPFVQRARITLLHKRVPHTVTYIELKAPPAWFPTISPLGKVPLLRVDGGAVLFESAVINEFIDETTTPPAPATPCRPTGTGTEPGLDRVRVRVAGQPLPGRHGRHRRSVHYRADPPAGTTRPA